MSMCKLCGKKLNQNSGFCDYCFFSFNDEKQKSRRKYRKHNLPFLRTQPENIELLKVWTFVIPPPQKEEEDG